MREIPLSRGLVALVDDEDYERLARYRWCSRDGGRTYYAVRNARKSDATSGMIRMHRALTGAGPGFDVDHINGNGLDNRRSNLRVVTHAQNMQNSTRKASGCWSRFKGVSFNKRVGKWIAYVKKDGTMRNLGYFSSEEQAVAAYASAARTLFGEFACPIAEAAE